MLVLGTDPGYKNLGLAIVDMSGERPEVPWSSNAIVGARDNPESFSRNLIPYLDNIYADHKFDAIAFETPPFIQREIKTTALLHRVAGVIEGWAVSRNLQMRRVPPTGLKARVRRLLDLPATETITKGWVRVAVERLTGRHGKTDHEDDAVMAAICCFGERYLG